MTYTLLLLKIHTAIDGIEAASFICIKQQQVAKGSIEHLPIRILADPNSEHLSITSAGMPISMVLSYIIIIIIIIIVIAITIINIVINTMNIT